MLFLVGRAGAVWPCLRKDVAKMQQTQAAISSVQGKPVPQQRCWALPAAALLCWGRSSGLVLGAPAHATSYVSINTGGTGNAAWHRASLVLICCNLYSEATESPSHKCLQVRKKASDERWRDLQHECHQATELPSHLLSQAWPGARALKLPAVRGDGAALVGYPEQWWAVFGVMYPAVMGQRSPRTTLPVRYRGWLMRGPHLNHYKCTLIKLLLNVFIGLCSNVYFCLFSINMWTERQQWLISNWAEMNEPGGTWLFPQAFLANGVIP